MAGLREITRSIAIAVGRACIEDGLATEPSQGVEAAVDAMMWKPAYPEYVPV
jgi:malic enzyme